MRKPPTLAPTEKDEFMSATKKTFRFFGGLFFSLSFCCFQCSLRLQQELMSSFFFSPTMLCSSTEEEEFTKQNRKFHRFHSLSQGRRKRDVGRICSAGVADRERGTRFLSPNSNLVKFKFS